MTSTRSWLIYGIAGFAYLVAVLQRTSLGVAAVEATDRFGVSAAALSSLAVVQIIVYAALQVPVGIAIDRVGPKVLIATGAVLMFAGQTVLALAPELWVALIGRVLVGGGDAMTFISVIRLLSAWFDKRSLPFASQTMGTVGQLGQILSAIPLSLVLHDLGWTPAYLSLASLSVVAVALVVVLVSNGESPIDTEHREPVWKTLRESLARPGTQLGFWSHFVTQSSVSMFSLLWGFPFLSVALGYGPELAATLLTVIVAAGIVSGPIIGLLSARFPFRRSNLVIGIVLAMAAVWGLVLSWPGTPPMWMIVILLVVIAIGGPGSLIGFDFARTFNPLRALGSATGVVNVGGFLATFVMMFLIGGVLDAIDRARGGTGIPSELYSFDAFRLAFLVQYLVVGVGMIFLGRARRRTRRRLHEQEGIRVAPLWVALMRAWRTRGAR